MTIFPLELVRENPRFLGYLPQKQDEKIAMCESWCYSHHNTVDSTLDSTLVLSWCYSYS